ncbi:MAG: c-type cytochrome [Roseinatronobacter sp.]
MSMKLRVAISAFALAAATLPAHAADPEAGAGAFASQCASCHVVQNEAGEVLAGRNARQGPNLYGVIGRQAGSVEGFRYGASLVEAGTAGLIWDEEQIVSYLKDPTDFLKTTLGNNRARSQMAQRVRKDEDAVNLAAFLATFSPAVEEEAAEEAVKTN